MAALWVIGVLLLAAATAVLTLWMWGCTLPARTHVICTTRSAAAPDTVVNVLLDIPCAMQGFEGTEDVSPHGEDAWRVRFVFTTLTIRPEQLGPHSVRWHVRDARGYIHVQWTFTAEADNGSTRLRLEENALTQSALARAWVRFRPLRDSHYADKGLRAIVRMAESGSTDCS